jgi:Asp-tRNA(Asn)/Glu-tRNA(Gln) amidotransferase A subunit family amidase
LDALREAGAEIEEIDIDWASEAIRLAHAHEEFLFAPEIERAMRDDRDLVCDYTPQLAKTATSVGADDYRASLTIAGQVWRDHFGPLFERFDAFCCPTVSCPEVPAENKQEDIVIVNGKLLTDTDTSMTVLFNMFSRCPALALPSGFTDAGLPTSLQIVGRPHDDATVFRIGSALERRRRWLDAPSRRPPRH